VLDQKPPEDCVETGSDEVAGKASDGAQEAEAPPA